MATTAPNLPNSVDHSAEMLLEFPDNRLLIDLCGEFDRNLTQIESSLGIQITRRGNKLALYGDAQGCKRANDALRDLYNRLEQGRSIEAGDIMGAINMGPTAQDTGLRAGDQIEMFTPGPVEIRTRKKTVEPRSNTQKIYVQELLKTELVFGLGPAGTGKTYLAVAAAVSMFIDGGVDRILLSRPAVEAGERLGFLPGDMKEKVDPYMQPLYDALHDFLPGKQVARLIEEKRIEIAPLAFMRGRTLSNAFVVLDEAQNATKVQMKMFLTRLGQGSRMAITGDTSQIDLPKGTGSGLIEAAKLLQDVKGVSFVQFTSKDVVRHPLVARIIEAYDSPHD